MGNSRGDGMSAKAMAMAMDGLRVSIYRMDGA